MKRTYLFLFSFTFILASCASTGGGSSGSSSSGSSDDGSMQIMGAVFSVLMGAAATESSGSAAQGQSIMQQTMSLFNSMTSHGSTTGADVQDGYAGNSSGDTSGYTQAAGGASSGPDLTSSFNADKYTKGGACADDLSYLADRLQVTNQSAVDDSRNARCLIGLHPEK